MILSILIPTIVGREDKFNRLMYLLYSQVEQENNYTEQNGIVVIKSFISSPFLSYGVELCYFKDNKEISIGSKRQKLIESATGKYIVFIDDDDTVSKDYIREIITAIKDTIPDSIGFRIECMIDGKGPFMATASNKWDDWAENKGGFKYVRTPYQKTPIKREIALQIGYKDMRYGEDYDYSKRLKESGLIKSEAFIDEVMYYYNFKYEDPKTKYGI